MRIIVIGGGLLGLTSAYFLRRCNHEVTLIERSAGVGLGTSFANGALLTPSMADPWNSPGCWRVLLASLVRSDTPLKVRWRALPSLSRWGIQFLRNSRPSAFQRSTLANLRLALYSREVMSSLRESLAIEYGQSARGTLRVFRNARSLEEAAAFAEHLAAAGLCYRKLSTQETVELEPALAPMAQELVGAIHYESDESGDAHRFCNALAEQARAIGVELLCDTNITELKMRAGRIVAARGPKETFTADAFVVAAASHSVGLLSRVGVRLPVRPAKGYSVTFDRPAHVPLSTPIVDNDYHSAVVPLGGAIRVAGTAEFTGYDLGLREDRVRNLIGLIGRILPQGGFDRAQGRPWCGLRPMSVDGVPIIGRTPIPNLWINTGHGHLGWTMAAGSGRLLADALSGSEPAIDTAAFSLERFWRMQ